MLAHGINEKLVEEEFINLKDSDGKFFIIEIVDTASLRAVGELNTNGTSRYPNSGSLKSRILRSSMS
jgi:hypothetical protein